MIKLTNEQLAKYWRDIPNDDDIINAMKNADFDTWPVLYTDLCEKWHCSARRVRDILAALSWYDNGDEYILIRSSSNCGFYKSKKPEVIAAYRREVYNRAMNTLKPLKKIKRVLNRNEQITIDDLLLFGDVVPKDI